MLREPIRGKADDEVGLVIAAFPQEDAQGGDFRPRNHVASPSERRAVPLAAVAAPARGNEVRHVIAPALVHRNHVIDGLSRLPSAIGAVAFIGREHSVPDDRRE
ncbi:hypothetical protein GCM10009801_23040 [Streptomyces albiaxialis]|uniref:Uncharacterized protein n=1 Tax=Streptomyces albiaxialis TaxID=329523 RepID=A0ABN2VT22_9ACTN